MASKSLWFLVSLVGLLIALVAILSRRERPPADPTSGGSEAAVVEDNEPLGDGDREPVESGPAPGSEPEPEAGMGSAEALRRIRELGTSLGDALDLVRPEPDPELLEELRRLVREGNLETAELLDAAEALPPGDPGATALILACAFGSEPNEETDARLANLASVWNAASRGEEQAALAAVYALSLGARDGALGGLAGDLMERAYPADPGAPSFPGLTSVRAWFALRDLNRVPPSIEANVQDLIDPASERYRVTHELWALLSRTDPERYGPDIVRAAREGNEYAREGIEDLGDERFLPDLLDFVDRPWSDGDDGWLAGAAFKGLVAVGSEDSLARLRRELESPRDANTRDLALEALRTWRSTGSWSELSFLGSDLEDDEEAWAAWEIGAERGWNRVRFRRMGASERDALAASLAEALTRLPSGSKSRAWMEGKLSDLGGR